MCLIAVVKGDMSCSMAWLSLQAANGQVCMPVTSQQAPAQVHQCLGASRKQRLAEWEGEGLDRGWKGSSIIDCTITHILSPFPALIYLPRSTQNCTSCIILSRLNRVVRGHLGAREQMSFTLRRSMLLETPPWDAVQHSIGIWGHQHLGS